MLQLAYLPSPSWNAIEIGPVRIAAYALVILVGIGCAILLSRRRLEDRGGYFDHLMLMVLWAVPLGLIGGRIYHVLTSPDNYFGPGFNGQGDPIKIFFINQGGLGIAGAVALGAVGIWIAARSKGYRFSAMLDVLAPGLLLAQAIGRWGNWFNQELFGGATDLPWGLKVDTAHIPPEYTAHALFHPTFLYESLWNVIGVILLLLWDRAKPLRGGAMFVSYMAYYTLGRIWVESLRIDKAEMITLFGITARLNVWIYALLFLIAVVLLAWLFRSGRASAEQPLFVSPEAEQRAAEEIAALNADKESAGKAQAATDEAAAEKTSIDEAAPDEDALGEAAPDGDGSAEATPEEDENSPQIHHSGK